MVGVVVGVVPHGHRLHPLGVVPMVVTINMVTINTITIEVEDIEGEQDNIKEIQEVISKCH